MEGPEDLKSMIDANKERRLQIIVSDEETGEELASANGVETMILLIAPDTVRREAYRHILIGDAASSVEILFDVFRDMADRVSRGMTLDLTGSLDDRLLLEMTEGLPAH
jgi:hypothetical protein